MSESILDSERKPLVYMRFRPAWAYIEGIREFGRFFCERTFSDPSVAERAQTILQETLENAVKYSTDDTKEEVELALDADSETLEIAITSTADTAHLEVLRKELALLYAQSPEDAYLAAFERAAGEANFGSRIGLARIRLEGVVDIYLQEQSNGRITITARGQLYDKKA